MPGSTWLDTAAIVVKLDEIIELLQTIAGQQANNAEESD